MTELLGGFGEFLGFDFGSADEFEACDDEGHQQGRASTEA